MVVIADQVTVCLAGADLLERPFLAHLEDPRRSDETFGLRRAPGGTAEAGNRLAILLGVLEFAVESFYAALQGGVELPKVAHHDNQVRSAECGVRSWRDRGLANYSWFRPIHPLTEAPPLRQGADGQQDVAGQGVLQLA